MAEANEKGIKHRIKWLIDGVTREKLQDPEFSLISEPFTIKVEDNDTKWTLSIQFNNEEYLFAGLRVDRMQKQFFADFDISIKDHLRAGEGRNSSGDLKKPFTGWLDFISFDKLFDPSMKYLENGTRMELIITIEYFDKNDDEEELLKTYPKFYNDTTLADFTLISSDDEPFKVHRLALADASDFFHKMFTIDMKEKQQASVKFEDIDSETLKEVIRFIYNGEADLDDVEKATNVIYAAEKFNLPGLKEICCKTFAKKICKENAVEILAIADMYHEKDLEDFCLKHILVDYDAVRQTDGWKSLTIPLFQKITDAFNADSKIPVITLNSTL